MLKSREERGVILILTLFVLLICYAMVAQLTLGTAVAWQITKNASDRIRLEYACKSAAEEVIQMLKDDAGKTKDEEELLEEELVSAASEQGLAGASDSDDEPEDPGLDTSACDSSRDSWWRPARYNYGDIEVTSWVEDENGKFNLHLLLVENEEIRVAAEEAFLRILDVLREDFEDDLDNHDSNRILTQLRELMDGDKRSEDYIPRAFRHSDSDESERVLLFALEELMLLQDVDEALFYDQVRPESRIAAGLESVFTVFTSVGLDPEGKELEGDTAAEASGEELNIDGGGSAEPEAGGAFGGGTGNQDETAFGTEEEIVEQELLAEAAAAGGLEDVLDGDPPLGTLINLNTAHRAVIEGIVSRDTLPLFMVDQILRYRNEVDEAARIQAEGEELDSNEMDLRRALYREDESIPLRVFASLEDLSEIEEWEERMDEESRATFEDAVGVSSDIFSLYLFARIAPDDWEQQDWYEEPPGSVLRMRTIVWRRNGENGAKLIILLPWHEVPYRRWRIPDFQEDLPAYVRPEW